MGSCFQPSGSQIAASTPVGGISCIPDGKGTKYCQLAAHLGHLTHLLHLHGVAKVGEQAFVPEVDEAPGANLERKVGALEAIALDGGLEVIVSFRFPLQGPRAAPMLAEESQGTVSSTRVTSGVLAFLLMITRSGFWAVMATSGGMVTPLILLPSTSAYSS